jgi:hypothetical protein
LIVRLSFLEEIKLSLIMAPSRSFGGTWTPEPDFEALERREERLEGAVGV